jgi:hypothetical protein
VYVCVCVCVRVYVCEHQLVRACLYACMCVVCECERTLVRACLYACMCVVCEYLSRSAILTIHGVLLMLREWCEIGVRMVCKNGVRMV